MGALLVIALKAGADVSQLLVWIGINAALTFFAANISWQGHVGGFAGGVALALVLAYAPRERRTAWQVSGFALVAVAVVVAVLLRTASLR
jgi:CDP-diglyceride synthetase